MFDLKNITFNSLILKGVERDIIQQSILIQAMFEKLYIISNVKGALKHNDVYWIRQYCYIKGWKNTFIK